jgi:hypothetical protein
MLKSILRKIYKHTEFGHTTDAKNNASRRCRDTAEEIKGGGADGASAVASPLR